MTGIIKFGDQGMAIRSLDPVTSVPAEQRRSAVELALDDALDEIARLRVKVVSAEESSKRRCEAARESGRREGLAAGADDGERALAALREAVDAASAAWRARLAEIDALAATLAREMLAKVFHPSADLADLVVRAIAARIEDVQAQGVTVVRASAADFGDAAALRTRLGIMPADAEVIVDATLCAGDCRIGLRLGRIDLGMERLRDELDAFLQKLQADEA